MPEHRIQITVSEHGFDLDNGDKLMETFMATAPEVGPSVSQNTETGTLSMTFSLDADDAKGAVETAVQIFTKVMATARFPVTKVLSIESFVVPDDEEVPTEDREPVLA
jgi:hypothetical protein